MEYMAIDGDISDFFDAMMPLEAEFETQEVVGFLLSEGHTREEALGALERWRDGLIVEVSPEWRTFRLTSAGIRAVEELAAGGRADHNP